MPVCVSFNIINSVDSSRHVQLLSFPLYYSFIYLFIYFVCVLDQPTRSDRGWLVMPVGKNPWWWYLASFVPALLVTILIFMDQQISAVIVNRKENKLKV